MNLSTQALLTWFMGLIGRDPLAKLNTAPSVPAYQVKSRNTLSQKGKRKRARQRNSSNKR